LFVLMAIFAVGMMPCCGLSASAAAAEAQAASVDVAMSANIGQGLAAEPGTAGQALAIVARQKGVFTAPPVVMPTRKAPDGPLLGNGDVGVVIGGVIERRKYFGLGEAGGANVTTRSMSMTNAPERHRS
jgi:hypothetical protein